jgi:prophage regulatory protein
VALARPEITSRRLLSYDDLKARGVPFSRMHLRRLEAAGSFPRHLKIGAARIAWLADEVDAFIEAKAAARPS